MIFVADQINSSGGYIGSDGVFREGTGYDLYIGSTNHSLVGMLKFNKSINSMLNTAVTSWSQLNFTYAGAEVKSRDVVPNYGYQIAISNGNPGLELNSGNVASVVDGIQWSGAATTNSIGWFDFTSLFKKLSSTNPTIVTPNTAPWYICIKNTNAVGSSKRFNRKQYFNSTLRINGGLSSSIHYYNGSGWVRCIPYYYNGAEWKQCLVRYWDGSGWRQT